MWNGQALFINLLSDHSVFRRLRLQTCAEFTNETAHARRKEETEIATEGKGSIEKAEKEVKKYRLCATHTQA